MAQKFLAQDCSLNLSAPVHFWHCLSCLQSLGGLMLSDQPECLWLTFAMNLLALTLSGVLVLVWKLLGSSQVPERLTSQPEESPSAPLWLQMCAQSDPFPVQQRKSSLHSLVGQSEGSLLWQARRNDYPPSLCTCPLDSDYSLGDPRSEMRGDDLSLCLSRNSHLTPQWHCFFGLCHPERSHEPWTSLLWSPCQPELWPNEHSRARVAAFFQLCVREPRQMLLLKDCCLAWTEHISPGGNTCRQYVSRISVLIDK